MRSKRRKYFSKETSQRITKIILWLGALATLLLIILWIAYSNNSGTKNVNTNNQTIEIEAQSAELSEEAERLESTLNELHFDTDIQVLRDQ